MDRYTWRHNQVLYILIAHIPGRLIRHNANWKKQDATSQPIAFTRAGQHPAVPKARARTSKPSQLLNKAGDWKLLVDIPEAELVFPPVICDTSLRPDVVMWSETAKTVIMGELTCPWEANHHNAHFRKTAKYQDLKRTIEPNGWEAHLFPFELPALGTAAPSFNVFLDVFGLPRKQASHIRNRCVDTVTRASYIIYKSHYPTTWHEFDLVKRPSQEALQKIFPSLRTAGLAPLH